MASRQPASSPTISRSGPLNAPSSSPHQHRSRAPPLPSNPSTISNAPEMAGERATRRNLEQPPGKENQKPRTMGAKSLGTTSSKAKPSSKSDLRESQPRRRPLQVQDSTDSESEIPPVRTVAQKTRNDPKSVAPLGLRRQNGVPEGETMSEKGEYVPPAKGSTKRKQ
ncbi:hypothetical protein M407DRAFT_18395 [Tulasnella calospora MUT 4182]|uniref:Uncharacterized protein n=1 Tax=Tulasnella calospora MUT 4182 TaxID=1051891 RepID=A0A0C3MFW7_9AGAM|nr:hypothetical protein M407DRAFT_18395 [Tulasnella calospora MUT 4182]